MKKKVIAIVGPTASGKTTFSIELAKRINLRITPQLMFEFDSSVEYGANISKVLKELDIQPEEDDDDEGDK